MKRNCIKIIVFILYMGLMISLVNAQSISALDAKRGFKDFKLGDSYQKWSSQLDKFMDLGADKSYFYKGAKNMSVFEYPVSNLILTFNDEKLVVINIDLGTWDKPNTTNTYTDLGKCLDQFSKLLKNFEALYGTPSNSQTDMENGKVDVNWGGSTTYLGAHLKYQGIKDGCRVSVNIGDKKFFLNKLNEGF